LGGVEREERANGRVALWEQDKHRVRRYRGVTNQKVVTA